MSRKKCEGCGRTFVGDRGLRVHQSGKNTTMACRPPRSPEEIRAEKVQTEYEKILTAAIIKHGSVVSDSASIYGWVTMDDYDLGLLGGWTNAKKHSSSCGIASTGRVEEDSTWYEFAGTFATSDHYKHGMEVHSVTCNCGKLTDRVFRWDASVGEAIRIVMMELLEERVDSQ
jgi:hypothetical protein